MSQDHPVEELSTLKKVQRAIFGNPKNINDPGIFHKLALIPLLAWVGLGADGISSSAYGPEEAFRTLGQHSYLAFFLAIASALTVIIISLAYSKIIEHFPNGGGGYIVATHLIGERAGVVSGSALMIDYILTIAVSVVSSVDALFSYLPVSFHQHKVLTASILIVFLMILNVRGLKESIKVLAPIFLIFILTHIVLLGYGIISNLSHVGEVVTHTSTQMSKDMTDIGFFGLLFIFIRAYSFGGGTYTGIEAVSNGLQVMKEPKVANGKRTMVYMAISLAIAGGGLLVCYLLVNIQFVEGKTLNSVLADTLYGNSKFGSILALITIVSEGAILLVAAQTGFIDAPRVMANMAIDSWLPRRFAAISERLTMKNGILIIGIAAILLLVYTNGSISALVVMYSINVFLTFTLSIFGMTKFFWQRRKTDIHWKKSISVQLLGLALSVTILSITVFEKFTEGGWLTLVITLSLVLLAYSIKKHYKNVNKDISSLEENLPDIFPTNENIPLKPLNKNDMTAIQLVGSYSGFGIHTFLSAIKSFPNNYKNFVFVSVAIVDQGLFKGHESVEGLKETVQANLDKYVQMALSLGFNAESRMETGTDLVEAATNLCIDIHKEYPKSTVFTGKLAFREEKFYHKLLHNESSYSIQRRLQWQGITNVILPIRIIG
jgi:amino acid transporter